MHVLRYHICTSGQKNQGSGLDLAEFLYHDSDFELAAYSGSGSGSGHGNGNGSVWGSGGSRNNNRV